jgi:signal transduction histidine kinase
LQARTPCSQQIRPNDPDQQLLDIAQQAFQQATELTRRLLAFAGKSVFGTPEPLNLSEDVCNSQEFIQDLVPRPIELRLDLRPDPPDVEADEAQIHVPN